MPSLFEIEDTLFANEQEPSAKPIFSPKPEISLDEIDNIIGETSFSAPEPIDLNYVTRKTAEEIGEDPDLMLAIFKRESSGNPYAVNKKSGARGAPQMLKSTAKSQGVNYEDPIDLMKGGVKYFADLRKKYSGDIFKAKMAYNLGDAYVDRAVEDYGDEWLDHLEDSARKVKGNKYLTDNPQVIEQARNARNYLQNIVDEYNNTTGKAISLPSKTKSLDELSAIFEGIEPAKVEETELDKFQPPLQPPVEPPKEPLKNAYMVPEKKVAPVEEPATDLQPYQALSRTGPVQTATERSQTASLTDVQMKVLKNEHTPEFLKSAVAGNLSGWVDRYSTWSAMNDGAYDEDVKRLRKEIAEARGEDKSGKIGKVVNQMAGMLPEMIKGMAARSAGMAVGSVVPGVGTAAGGQAASTAWWSFQGAGPIYEAMVDAGVSKDVAKTIMVPAAVMYGSVESLQVPGLLGAGFGGRFKKLLAEKTAAKIAKFAGKEGFDFAKELGEEGLQEILKEVAVDLGMTTKEGTAAQASPQKKGYEYQGIGAPLFPEAKKTDFTDNFVRYAMTALKTAKEAGWSMALLKGLGLAGRGANVALEKKQPPPGAEATPTTAPITPRPVSPEVAPKVPPEVPLGEGTVGKGAEVATLTPEETKQVSSNLKRVANEEKVPYDEVEDLISRLSPEDAAIVRAGQEAAERDIQKLSYDKLTGLFNRQGYEVNTRRKLEKEQGRKLSEEESDNILKDKFDNDFMLLVDLDKFKTVNDTHGHRAGDAVLQKASKIFSKRLGKYGELFRFGGEENAGFFGKALDKPQIEDILNRVEDFRKELESTEIETFNNENKPVKIKVTVSGGFGKGVSEADANLYKAKESGRNRLFAEGNEYVRLGRVSEEQKPQDEIRPAEGGVPQGGVAPPVEGQVIGKAEGAETPPAEVERRKSEFRDTALISAPGSAAQAAAARISPTHEVRKDEVVKAEAKTLLEKVTEDDLVDRIVNNRGFGDIKLDESGKGVSDDVIPHATQAVINKYSSAAVMAMKSGNAAKADEYMNKLVDLDRGFDENYARKKGRELRAVGAAFSPSGIDFVEESVKYFSKRSGVSVDKEYLYGIRKDLVRIHAEAAENKAKAVKGEKVERPKEKRKVNIPKTPLKLVNIVDESLEADIRSRLVKRVADIQRGNLGANVFLDPEFLGDVVYLGAIKIQKGINDTAEWTRQMATEVFGKKSEDLKEEEKEALDNAYGEIAKFKPDTKVSREEVTVSLLRKKSEETEEDVSKVDAERDAQIQALLNKVADDIYAKMSFGQKLKTGWKSWLDAYRYQNILSGVRTHERNIISNIWRTYIEDPLLVKPGTALWGVLKHPMNAGEREVLISDLPKYWRDLFINTGVGLKAAALSFKKGELEKSKYEEQGEKVKVGRSGKYIEDRLKQKVPSLLTGVSRFLLAQDRYFTSVHRNAMAAQLMRHGMNESKAYKEADASAENLMFRTQMGKTKPKKGELSRREKVLAGKQSIPEAFVDGVGEMLLGMRKLPIGGTVAKIYVPFITTPLNIVKEGIKMSPLALAGNIGKYSQQDIAKILIGGAISTASFGFAMSGMMTWAPPKDEERKRAYYASGRRPYSVKIGDKWVPYSYFGAAALPMGIAASIVDQYRDNPKKFDRNFFERLGMGLADSYKILIGQATLTSLRDGIEAVSGGWMDSGMKVLASPVKQLIPFSQLQAWINHTFIDPKYRKASGLMEEFMKTFPFASKNLPAYQQKVGGVEGDASESVFSRSMPYSIGKSNRLEDYLYQQSVEKKQRANVEGIRKKEGNSKRYTEALRRQLRNK